jgi:hypothetical protein
MTTSQARINVVAVAAVALLASGCSTFAASRYTISAETVSALRVFRGQSVSVGPFTTATSSKNDIMCRRVGPITTPDGEPFEQYIRKALIDELTIAEMYAPSAPVTISGRLEEIDFASGLYWADAGWKIALTLASSNGHQLAIREEYAFKGSYGGETGCQQTAQALMPAVQNLVNKPSGIRTFHPCCDDAR